MRPSAHSNCAARVSRGRLGAALRLVLELIKLRYSLGEEDFELLSAHLSPCVREYDGATIGWEEVTDAAMTHLLRTVLAKAQKQSTSATAPKLEMPGDTKKLKKQVATLGPVL